MSRKSPLPARLALLLVTSLAAIHTGMAADNETPGLGTPVTPADLAQFDLIVEPDGAGLPAGAGTAMAGEAVFRSRCQSCHGESGEGRTSATVLVGGSMQSEGPPLRTVGSYWPHATTLFDFIRRAMPADAPKSLSASEVYQVTAYVLYLNGIVARDEVIDADTLPAIEMPNRDGFVDQSHLQ